MKCGCRDCDFPDHSPSIKFCPLHAAAEETAAERDRLRGEKAVADMHVEALRDALTNLMSIQDCTDDCWCHECSDSPKFCEACEARIALSASEARTP